MELFFFVIAVTFAAQVCAEAAADRVKLIGSLPICAVRECNMIN